MSGSLPNIRAMTIGRKIPSPMRDASSESAYSSIEIAWAYSKSSRGKSAGSGYLRSR